MPCGLEGAAQDARLAVEAGGGQQPGDVVGQAVVAEGEAPQPWMVTGVGLGRAAGGERASGWAAGTDRRAGNVAGLQVTAEFAETGGSRGQAPADTKPVTDFLVAGHPLGRAAPARCWLVAEQRPSTASADTSPLLIRIGYW